MERKMAKILQLKSHEEWLKHRKKRIGGSEASCVLGLNPYKTNIELWQEKTGRAEPEDISEKPYVKYGTQAEPYLRELFKLDFPQYEVNYIENNMFLNDKYPFAHASLDGWLVDTETGQKGILEIKTTEILQSMQREKWAGQIPDNYYIQCLHYLMVTEWDFVILKAQLKSVFNGEVYLQIKHYRIDRQEVQEDIDFLEQREKVFYENIIHDREPSLILPKI